MSESYSFSWVEVSSKARPYLISSGGHLHIAMKRQACGLLMKQKSLAEYKKDVSMSDLHKTLK